MLALSVREFLCCLGPLCKLTGRSYPCHSRREERDGTEYEEMPQAQKTPVLGRLLEHVQRRVTKW